MSSGEPEDIILEGSVEHQNLIEACTRHYQQTEVNEKDVLPWFVYSVNNSGKREFEYF